MNECVTIIDAVIISFVINISSQKHCFYYKYLYITDTITTVSLKTLSLVVTYEILHHGSLNARQFAKQLFVEMLY